MSNYLTKIDDIVWGPLMIMFLLGSHIYLTYKTGFIQKYIFKAIKLSVSKDSGSKGELSIFGSLMTALSSTIGTGNIIGVGTAIAAGGPGAVLWTWIGGLFGIATKYSESYMAVKYRHKHSNDEYSGGAMTLFEHFKMPFMAKLFAILCSLCAFGIGCATQSAAIADLMYENFSIDKTVVAIILCAITAIVIIGGVKSIANVCSGLVPFMSIVYVIGCIIILFINGNYIIDALKLILDSAFTTRAAFGGFVGTTIRSAAQNGISRGLFSNEAGMGSAPQATAASKADNAVKPALVGSTGVFWDTVVVCLMTGLVLVTSIMANDSISCIVADGSIIKGASLVSKCFSQIPVIGTPLLVFGILTFAYSTILGWEYYGENTVRYLFGHRGRYVYRVLWVIVVYVGVKSGESMAWVAADILNALMCIPNIIGVLMIREQLAKDTKYYLNHLDEVDSELE